VAWKPSRQNASIWSGATGMIDPQILGQITLSIPDYDPSMFGSVPAQ
jgi:hypothetical protein